MSDTAGFFVECETAEEVDRALGLGFAVVTTPAVAAECGAPSPGQEDLEDPLEDVLEAHLHPYGDAEVPDDERPGR